MSPVTEALSLSLLGRVAKYLEFSPPPIKLVGVHSCIPLGMLLSQQHNSQRLSQNPHLIITADLDMAETFVESLSFWSPNLSAKILPAFDVSIYSGLYPSPRIIAQRLNWLLAAKNALPGEIFVAPVEALMQKTLPFSAFIKNCLLLERGAQVPLNFTQYLRSIGYVEAPTVEDVGCYSARGGLIDIYSPSSSLPFRIELFGDQVESIRSFNAQTQMSVGDVTHANILPAREVFFNDENRQGVAQAIARSAANRKIDKDELSDILRSVSQGLPFHGMDFLLPYFYSKLDSPLDYFSLPLDCWVYDHLDVTRASDQIMMELKSGYAQAENNIFRVEAADIYAPFENIEYPSDSTNIWVDKISLSDESSLDITEEPSLPNEFRTYSLRDFASGIQAFGQDVEAKAKFLKDKISRWHANGYSVFVATDGHGVAERLKVLFERANIETTIVAENDYSWSHLLPLAKSKVCIVLRNLPESFRIPDDNLVFLRDTDILGRRRTQKSTTIDAEEKDRSEALSFGELKTGELVAHRIHGIGIYEGLRVMDIDGAPAEFIELKYKDNDKLYLPVYRVSQLHKYAGPASLHMLDRLGGPGWAKTKTKVRNQLRDIAAKLLKLYAKRSQLKRPRYQENDEDYYQFEDSFLYQETDDQLRAIRSVLDDLATDHPMDRLVCGDVGFGKTEVAMRAAFKVAQAGRQVAIIAPTTILTHQHYENFKKRFAKWPIEVRALNRFVPAAEVKKTLQQLKAGEVDIVIGTHRLLSKDVQFKNLGLLVIDEEQKFGVTHKERMRYMRESVDTLTLSATPIPRTLNLSLAGIRDLSIINTPPVDRLPTRTFVCKFDKETIRKGIEGEIARGGQVFFLHNRVQSIDEIAAQLREIVPTARLAVAHGQMEETQLEKTMLKFINHEVDVLICTAIIESGMDIPRANTIFINNAQTFGVSQLYQLRGRVGRSKERAYCYLLIPPNRQIESAAKERLKIIQEHTALGSGLIVAQYDLELRGAGDILGEDQSGHINAVGYELYMELLEEALNEQKGTSQSEEPLDPEINLRIPALLPDKYIPDVRMRLYYYKSLSNIRSVEEIDRIEQELHDQFGPLPEPVMNFLGLMLIRKLCRDLGVSDIGSGKNSLTLSFVNRTPLPPAVIIKLTAQENKKYQLTPDQRLKIRMNEIHWPRIVDELEHLLNLCPKGAKI